MIDKHILNIKRLFSFSLVISETFCPDIRYIVFINMNIKIRISVCKQFSSKSMDYLCFKGFRKRSR